MVLKLFPPFPPVLSLPGDQASSTGSLLGLALPAIFQRIIFPKPLCSTAKEEGASVFCSTALKCLELCVLNPEPRSNRRQPNGMDDGGKVMA